MKATGIVRKIDELGRIVIPKELRKILGIETSSALEIYTSDDGEIILKRYRPGCQCGEAEPQHLIRNDNLIICKQCLTELNKKKNKEM